VWKFALFGAKNSRFVKVYGVSKRPRREGVVPVRICGYFADKGKTRGVRFSGGRVKFSRFCAYVFYGWPLIVILVKLLFYRVENDLVVYFSCFNRFRAQNDSKRCFLDSLCNRGLLRSWKIPIPRGFCYVSFGNSFRLWFSGSNSINGPYLHGNAARCPAKYQFRSEFNAILSFKPFLDFQVGLAWAIANNLELVLVVGPSIKDVCSKSRKTDPPCPQNVRTGSPPPCLCGHAINLKHPKVFAPRSANVRI